MKHVLRILLVDDEVDFVEPVRYWLKMQGHVVTTAANGAEALQLLKHDTPNIIFLDINMPVMDGVETLTRIKKLYPTLPVIMLTAAHHDQDLFTKTKTLGASGFFPKQSSLAELGAVIDTILRMHEKGGPSSPSP